MAIFKKQKNRGKSQIRHQKKGVLKSKSILKVLFFSFHKFKLFSFVWYDEKVCKTIQDKLNIMVNLSVKFIGRIVGGAVESSNCRGGSMVIGVGLFN